MNACSHDDAGAIGASSSRGDYTQRPADRRPEPCRLLERGRAALARLERLAVDDADPGQLPGPLGIDGLRRLLLDEHVDLVEVRDVVGVHGVEVELGEVDELGRRRVGRLRQRVHLRLLHRRYPSQRT
jgi:hypothetical protein